MAAVLLVTSAAWAGALTPKSAAGRAFPKTAFSLPLVDGIKMDWVLPPSLSQLKGKAKTAHLRFDADPAGHPWFADGADRVLMSPKEDIIIRTAARFDDSVFLDGGAQLVCTDRYLAIPSAGDKEHRKLENGLLQVDLRAFLKLDHPGCRLFSGGKDLLYIVVHNEETGKDEVSTLRSGDGAPARAEKILSSSERITALAGDGDKTYFVLGKWIMELPRGASKAKPIFAPKDTPTSLAYSKRDGLFYATKSEMGFWSP
ncbi:MAG TPA: hypothetical protein VH309_04025, partial [Elusimicrobiota bacterium]|nr:hypothetical protein [Elusimicrobiota bacterium]